MITRRILVSVLVLATVAGSAGVAYRKLFRWKRFDTVAEGVLYRSGQLKPWQLRSLIRDKKIRSVFSFTLTAGEEEQQICDDAQVKRYFHYLHGDGVGPDDPYLRFLQVVQDPANLPMLVHCSAGVQRTGGAVALYRVLMDQWPIEQALTEMTDKGNDGNIAQREQLLRIAETFRERRLAITAATPPVNR